MFQRSFGNTRALGGVDIKELAANVSATGNFLDIAAPDKSRATQTASELYGLLDSGGVVKESDRAAARPR